MAGLHGELLTTRTTTRLETRNKREHLDCETKRGNLDTRAAPAIPFFYFSLQPLLRPSPSLPPSIPRYPVDPESGPVSSDRGIRGQDADSASPRRDILASWNESWKSRCTRSDRRRFSLSLSSYLFAPLVRRCMCDQLVLRIVLNTRNNLWTGHDDDWNIYSARYTPGAHLYTMESRRATPPVQATGWVSGPGTPPVRTRRVRDGNIMQKLGRNPRYSSIHRAVRLHSTLARANLFRALLIRC